MSNHYTRVRIECDAFEGELQVDDLRGREAISELFEFEVLVVVPGQAPIDPDDIVTSMATLIFEVNEVPEDDVDARARWTEVRRVHGLVCECDDLMLGANHQSYRLRLVPRFWLTTLIETLDIFMDLSVPAIIRKKLAALELVEGEDYEFRLDESKYFEREFVVQYKESDLAFISRLCEHYGICYFFVHNDDQDVVVFADDNSAFAPISGDSTVHFEGRGEERSIYDLRTKTRVVPRVFVQRDYNYRTPQNDLTAMTEMPMGNGGGIVEYGGHFKNESEGQWLADMRAQEHQCARKVLQGQGAMPRLGAGASFHLEGHSHGDRELVVTRVIHRANQTTLMEGAGDEREYRNEFFAIDREIPFRPPRVTPKPRVDGMVTGIVDGAGSGQYAEVDDQGRYRVRFLFDTAERGEAQASRCVRMMQPHSGAGYGMHFPLRPGTEVLITFIGGDPDRPIIAGTVPNPQTASPVAAENLTKNVIRTGGGNQIEIEDEEDNHRIKLTTPHADTTFQLGSPNGPEKGALLSTMGASTTLAATGAGTVGAFQSAYSIFETYRSGGDIVTVAKKPGPEAGFLAFVGIVDALVSAAIGIIGCVEAGMEVHEKAKAKEATDAAGAATKAADDCKKCRAVATKILDDRITALEGPPAPAAGSPEEAELAELRSRKAADEAYNQRVDAVDAAHNDVLVKRDTMNAKVAAASTTTTDQHDTAAVENARIKTEDHDKAQAEYQALMDGGTVRCPHCSAAYHTGATVCPTTGVTMPTTPPPAEDSLATLQASTVAAPTTPTPTLGAYIAAQSACQTSSCGEVAAKRKEAKDANDSYNNLVTAHGPHKDNCSEAKTYLGMYQAARTGVGLIISVILFFIAKLKKSLKHVELLAQWGAASTAVIASVPGRTPADPAAVGAKYLATPLSPLHHVGSQNSMWLTSCTDMMVSSDTVMILGMGATTDPTNETTAPKPTSGKVGIVGIEEVRVMSKGDCEVAAFNESRMSAMTVDIRADTAMKITAQHRQGLPGAKMDLLSDDTTTITSDKKNVEIKATLGEIKIDGKTKITETTTDYALTAKVSAKIEAKKEIHATAMPWKLMVQSNGGQLGQATKLFMVTDASAMQAHSGSKVVTKPDGVKITGAKIDISGQGIATVKGSKIMIG